jgi:hypothetical protein
MVCENKTIKVQTHAKTTLKEGHMEGRPAVFK